MAFDLEKEIAASRKSLGELRGIIAGGADRLRQLEGYSLTCQQLAARLSSIAQALPPPVPPPPIVKQNIRVKEHQLVPARTLLGAGMTWLTGVKIDTNGMVPQLMEVTKVVELHDPMLPGSGPRQETIELEIMQPVSRDLVDQPGGFVYALQPARQQFSICPATAATCAFTWIRICAANPTSTCY
jgi:hypothetical protein